MYTPLTDDYYIKSICPSGGHGRGLAADIAPCYNTGPQDILLEERDLACSGDQLWAGPQK